MAGRKLLRILGRAEPLAIALVPAVVAALVFCPDYRANPDSYYHVGTAALYAEHGWLRDFPWLGYTVLGHHFTDVHLLLHLALAPLAGLCQPQIAQRLSVILMSTGLAASLWLVLRRWKVGAPAVWVTLALFGSPFLAIYAVSLKGGAAFFIILVWLIDAIWARAVRRTFVLSWLSVYAYVGAPVLVPLVLVFFVVVWLWDEAPPWKLVAAVVAGLVAGLLVNPFWPDQWGHIASEIASVFTRPANLPAGQLRGSEWLAIPTNVLLRISFAFLAAWFVLLVRQLGRDRRVSAGTAAGAVVALGLLCGAMMAGPKILYLFFLTSVLFVPRLAHALRPWPRRVAIGAALLATLNAGYTVRETYRQTRGHPTPEDYAAVAHYLEASTPKGQVVVAAWDDFPGLFLFDRHNRYVVGMNPEFLLRENEKRFNAYAMLFLGKVSDPEQLLPTFFDDAQLIVVRNPPRGPGENALANQLEHSPHFTRLYSPSPYWIIFSLNQGSAGGKPESPSSGE